MDIFLQCKLTGHKNYLLNDFGFNSENICLTDFKLKGFKKKVQAPKQMAASILHRLK